MFVIILSYCQVLGATARFPALMYPAAFAEFLRVLDTFSLEIPLAEFQCQASSSSGVGFLAELAVSLLCLPGLTVLCAVLGLFLGCGATAAEYRTQQVHRVWEVVTQHRVVTQQVLRGRRDTTCSSSTSSLQVGHSRCHAFDIEVRENKSEALPVFGLFI